MYSQSDPRWSFKPLGRSGLNMRYYGCLVTAVAEALTLNGHLTSPGQVCDKLNANGGFLNNGWLVWAKVEQAYSQFHFNRPGCIFIQGVYAKFQHWVMEYEGKIYDPLTGKIGVPEGFKPTGHKRKAYIDPVTEPDKKDEPKEEPKAEKRIYTVVKGDTLWGIALKNYKNGQDWKKIYEANKDKIKNPDLIYPGQELIIP